MYKASSTLHFVKSTQFLPKGAVDESHWTPNTDVYSTESGLVIKVELAGLHRDDLELIVEGNRLCIRGHRMDTCRAAKCNFLVMEINYGRFECIIELPPGHVPSRAAATYTNGFLRIDVPTAAVPEARNIMVEGSADDE